MAWLWGPASRPQPSSAPAPPQDDGRVGRVPVCPPPQPPHPPAALGRGAFPPSSHHSRFRIFIGDILDHGRCGAFSGAQASLHGGGRA